MLRLAARPPHPSLLPPWGEKEQAAASGRAEFFTRPFAGEDTAVLYAGSGWGGKGWHAWKQAQPLQRGSNGNIERPSAASVQIERGFEHLIGAAMNPNRARRRIAVEPAHVAGALVEAHQAMHHGDSRERR